MRGACFGAKKKGMERAKASEKSERAGVAQARPGSGAPPVAFLSLSLRLYAMASTPDRASDVVDLLTDLG